MDSVPMRGDGLASICDQPALGFLDAGKTLLATWVPVSLRPTAWWLRRVRRQGRRFGVLFGPFAGMRLVAETAFLPELLGIWEQELHPVIEGLIAADPDLVVNVGGANGYYAVGLARRIPRAAVV